MKRQWFWRVYRWDSHQGAYLWVEARGERHAKLLAVTAHEQGIPAYIEVLHWTMRQKQ